MSVMRILAGTFAALLLGACASSPTAASRSNADSRPAFDTAPRDSTQTVGRGHMFGSGT